MNVSELKRAFNMTWKQARAFKDWKYRISKHTERWWGTSHGKILHKHSLRYCSAHFDLPALWVTVSAACAPTNPFRFNMKKIRIQRHDISWGSIWKRHQFSATIKVEVQYEKDSNSAPIQSWGSIWIRYQFSATTKVEVEYDKDMIVRYFYWN